MIRRPPRSTLFPTRRSSDLHLKKLRESGLVEEDRDEFDSRVRIYRLKPKPMADLKRWLEETDRKSTRLNSSHLVISYAVFCLKKNKIRCDGALMVEAIACTC